jgi:YD repeat-containing protein
MPLASLRQKFDQFDTSTMMRATIRSRSPTPAVAYDPAGKVLQTRQSANGSILRTTSATYTRAGKPETTTDAGGNITRFAYDPLDRLAAATDPTGRSTRYAYDRLDRAHSIAGGVRGPAGTACIHVFGAYAVRKNVIIVQYVST